MRNFLVLAVVVAVVALLPLTATAQSAIVIDLGNDTAMVVAFGSDGSVVVVPSAPILRLGGPSPPSPPPSSNPYLTPQPAMQQVVNSLTKFPLSRTDATNIANVYGDAASKTPSVIQTTDDLRATIIHEGKLLNLKGKYTGLAEAIDKVLEQLLGLDKRDTTAADAVALKAVAWALWKAGEPGK